MIGRFMLLASLLVLWPVEQAFARSTDTSEAAVASCIHRAASGRVWLEKTLWGLRDQEAGWVGAQIPNRDGSHDLGPLQVNSWWVNRIAEQTGRQPSHVRYWLIHDACFNIDAARWIFLSALVSTRDYWTAIGVYHSPTGWRQRRYMASVAGKLMRRFGADMFTTKLSSKGGRDPGGAGTP